MNETERAIETMKKTNLCNGCTSATSKGLENCNVCDNCISKKVIMQALQEKAERDNPQPLTIEELKQMVGEPVWHTRNDCWIVVDAVRKMNTYSMVYFWNYDECDYVYSSDEENSPFYKHKPNENELKAGEDNEY